MTLNFPKYKCCTVVVRIY